MMVRNEITVLMYHAIDCPEETSADPHYTVRRPDFAEHLRVFHRNGRPGRSVLELLKGGGASHAVGLTFDDGHESNLHAAETLAAVDMSADFFINPSAIGTTCFLSWDALRDMQQMGMSIQSHGMTHRYLNDLSPAEVRRELADSKATIEDRLGVPVSLFAPPGGRKPEGFAQLAGELGYEAICSSDVGIWRPGTGAGAAGQADLVPRLAVLATTGADRLQRWVMGAKTDIWMMQSRGRVLAMAKRAVGNQRYERLRGMVVGGPPSDGDASTGTGRPQ